MSPAERNEAWRELTAVYMPWMRLDDILVSYTHLDVYKRQVLPSTGFTP